MAKKQEKKKSGPVTTRRKGVDQLDPVVRETAMRLADGDPKRVKVVSRTEAVVS